MNEVRNACQKHKKLFCTFVFGFAILLNCFGFPVYNLSKTWSFPITAVLIFVTIGAASFTGTELGKLFPGKSPVFIVFLTLGLACVGMGCRFLMEFGEVSNSYDFTLPNIVLHLTVFVALTMLNWLRTVKSL